MIDLLEGQAVHARGGVRAHYRPVQEVGGVRIPAGDAPTLVRAYADLGVQHVYVADLDAIMTGTPQDALVATLAARAAVRIWLDAAVTSVARAQQIVDLGVARVVVGLETLTSFEALAKIGAAIGSDATVFSLDLREGVPLTRPDFEGRDGSPCALAARAASAGAGTIIVLDLARVGSGAGLDLPIIERVRRTVPGVRLFAGGGVRDEDDLTRLAGVGCDGALVGSALQKAQIPNPKSQGWTDVGMGLFRKPKSQTPKLD